MGLKTNFENLCEAIKNNDMTEAEKHVRGARDELKCLEALNKNDKNFKNAIQKMCDVIRFVEEKKFTDANKNQKAALGPFRMELKWFLRVPTNGNENGQNQETASWGRDGCSKGVLKDNKQDNRSDDQLEGCQSAPYQRQNPMDDVKFISDTKSNKIESRKYNDKLHKSVASYTEAHVDGPNTRTHEKDPCKSNFTGDQLTFQDADRTSFAKHVSQAMQRNNPDIADLSDANRPTKLAERFSELYDNEWTEAFEVLSCRNAMPEVQTIKFLLDIIQEAYKLCTLTAEQQIRDLASAFIQIMSEGKCGKMSSVTESLSKNSMTVLVDLRKVYAHRRINILQQDFVQQRNRKNDQERAVLQYTAKSVELAWWMCVQDPPVYMCPTNDTASADRNLYRAYTKSGEAVAYFVWPALRLYKDGGVLMKGVAQYK